MNILVKGEASRGLTNEPKTNNGTMVRKEYGSWKYSLLSALRFDQVMLM